MSVFFSKVRVNTLYSRHAFVENGHLFTNSEAFIFRYEIEDNITKKIAD